MRPKNYKSMTLIEVMVSVLVFSIIFAAFMTLIDTTIRITRASSKIVASKVDLDSAANSISREIRLAVVDTISRPSINDRQKVMAYRVQTGFQGAINGQVPRMVLSPERSLRLVDFEGEDVSNGTDDNGNGIVDEGMVVIETTGTGQRINLIGNIVDLEFSRDNRPSITMTLTRAYRDATDRDQNGVPKTKFEQVVRSIYLANNQPAINVILEETLGTGGTGNSANANVTGGNGTGTSAATATSTTSSGFGNN